MRRLTLALGVALPLLSGCYHVTVVTGAPAAPDTVERKWQNSFVYGLVPPPELNVSEQCPNGMAKVETRQSFLNWLVSAITYSIYTPVEAKVTCASGPVPR